MFCRILLSFGAILILFTTPPSFSQEGELRTASEEEQSLSLGIAIERAESQLESFSNSYSREQSSWSDRQKFDLLNKTWISLAQATFDFFSIQKLLKLEAPSISSRREIKQALERLLLLSKLRAEALNELRESGDTEFFQFSSDYLNTIKYEVKSVPYRWYGVFYLGYAKVQEDLKGGIRNFFSFVEQILSLLLVLFFVILAKRTYPRLDEKLRLQRSLYLRRAYSDSKAKAMALWIERIRPFLPWVLVYGICKVAELVILGSYIPELAIVVPYVILYSYYRIFRLLFSLFLKRLSRSGKMAKNSDLKIKIESSSVVLGRSLLISFWVSHSIQSTLSKGILYFEVYELTYWFIVLVLLFIMKKWQEEIAQLIEERSNTRWGIALANSSRNSLLLAPLGFLVASILVFGDFLFDWIQNFEFGRKLAASLFKKKINNRSQKETSELSFDSQVHEYTQHFLNLESAAIDVYQREFERVASQVESWLERSSGSGCLAVVGDKGMGKSYLCNKIANKLSLESIEVQSITVSEKVCTVDSFLRLTQDSIPSISESRNSKTLILLDDAENLFLSKVGGFEAIKKCFDRLTSDKEDIFWVLFFDTHSWHYLKHVLKKDHIFSDIIELEEWSQENIRLLIENRHKQLEAVYKLSFDEILAATRGDSESDFESEDLVEEKFYQLLTEESYGNPRCAIHLWPSCLRESQTESSLQVGLPKERNTSKLLQINDSSLFLLASILRHSEIGVHEIREVTELSDDIVKGEIKSLVQKKFLYKNTDGTYAIDPKWQHKIHNYLSGKNLIYGN